MSLRKVLSMLLVVTMLASVFTCMVVKAALPDGYYVLDDYDEQGFHSWTCVTGTTGSPVGSVVEVEEGKYAFNLHATNTGGSGISIFALTVADGDGVALESNKNIVIESRIRIVAEATKIDSNGPRLYFGINSSMAGSFENAGGALFAANTYSNIAFNGSDFYGPAGQTTVKDAEGNTIPLNEKWFNLKAVMKGTSGKVDLYVTLDDGTVVWDKTDLAMPKVGSTSLMNPTHLKNITIGEWRNEADVQVDYLYVYETYPITATTATTVSPGEEIKVVFDKDDASLINAVDLYDAAGTNLILAQKSYDATTKTVSFDPELDFVEGASYTVKVDANILKASGYEYEGKASFTVECSKYIINDDYSATDLGDWYAKHGTGSVSAYDINGDGTNFAAAVTAASSSTEMAYEFNNGLGVEFEDGKNLVLETRVKKSTASNRAFVKMNLGEAFSNGTSYSFATSNTGEWLNGYYSLFNLHDSNGLMIATQSSWIKGTDRNAALTTDFVNNWLDVKLEFKGTTGKADATFTSGGQTVTVTDIVMPMTASSSVAPGFDKFNTLSFRPVGTGGNPCSETILYVDYLRVYKEAVVTATVPSVVAPAEDVKVTFDIDDQALLGAVNLYDAAGTTMIAAQKSYDAATKTAIINPDENLTEGANYTVKFDTQMIKTFGYKLNGAESVTIKASRYIVNETYANGDKGGWSNGSASAVTDSLTGADNYAVKFSYNTSSDIAFSDYTFNDGKGIPYEDGKNLVIETRVLASSANGRMYLGMNRAKTTNPNGAGNGSIFIIWAGEGTTSTAQNTYDRKAVPVVGSSNEVWFNVKLTMLGTTGKGNLLVTLDDGTVVYDIKDKYFPCNNNGNTPTDLGYDQLDTLSVAAWRGDVATYVDSLKVYKTTPATASTGASVKPSANIEVKFDKEIPGIKDAVKLYNAEGTSVIPSDVSYIAATKTVVINPDDNLTAEANYKVIIDKAVVENAGFGMETYEFPVKASAYIINEDYAENDFGGWELLNSGKGTLSSVLVDGANYAMNLNITATDNIAVRKVNGNLGVAYEDGKNVVIETKFKTDTQTGRYNLKLNADYSVDERASGNYSLTYLFPGTSLMYFPNNEWSQKQEFADQTQWITARYVIEGKTGNINSTYQLGNGTPVNYPTANVYLSSGWRDFNKDALKTLSFRNHTDNRNITVDYLRVYQNNMLTVGAPENFEPGKTITVSFDTPAPYAGFVDCVELYDATGVTKLETVNTYDETAKTVTLTYETGFANGETYVIKFNKEALFAAEYETGSIKDSYPVEISKYLIEDTFDDGTYAGWALNSNAGAIGVEPVEGEEGNQAFKFTDTTAGDDGQIAIRTFASPIAHKAGFNTVLETRIKHTNGNARSYFKVNIDPSFSAESGGNNYMLVQLERNGNQIIYPEGVAVGATNNVMPAKAYDVSAAEMDNVWFTVKAYFDGSQYVKIQITNEATNKTQTVTGDLSHYAAANADYSTLRNVALRTRTNTDDVYVDYLKIYYEEKAAVTPSYEVSIVKADGTEVTELQRGESYSIHFDVATNDATPSRLNALMAVYKDGELIAESLVGNSFIALKHQNRSTVTFEIPEDGTEKYEIKGFIWDSLNGMKPVATPAYASTPELK